MGVVLGRGLQTAPVPVWAEDESSSHIHVRVLPLAFEGSGGEHEDLVRV